MIQQVKDEIIAAFADVPRPTTVIAPSLAENNGWLEATQVLLGKDWKELDSLFLEQNATAFYGLSAEAYQYYLPALLIQSLESPSESKRNLQGTTLYTLMPNYWRIMYEDHDKWFEYQKSTLTERQRYAVCSFLEAMFDEPLGYKSKSAQCLKWGWHIPDHPVSAKIRDYYYSLHNFNYTRAINPKHRRLIDIIRNAFDDTPAPTDILNRRMFREGDEEGPDYALEFQGLNWRTLHPNFLSSGGTGYGTALIFFSDEEFRYFLPSFMIADVWVWDKFKYDRVNSEHFHGAWDAVFSLTYGLNKLRSQTLIEAEKQCSDNTTLTGNKTDQEENADYCQFAQFTTSERKAIIAYLKFKMGESLFRRERRQIKSALRNYWLKTV